MLYCERSNVDMDTVEIEISKISNKITNYNPNNFYSVCETELFYRMVSDETLLIRYGNGQKQPKDELPFFE